MEGGERDLTPLSFSRKQQREALPTIELRAKN